MDIWRHQNHHLKVAVDCSIGIKRVTWSYMVWILSAELSRTWIFPSSKLLSDSPPHSLYLSLSLLPGSGSVNKGQFCLNCYIRYNITSIGGREKETTPTIININTLHRQDLTTWTRDTLKMRNMKLSTDLRKAVSDGVTLPTLVDITCKSMLLKKSRLDPTCRACNLRLANITQTHYFVKTSHLS